MNCIYCGARINDDNLDYCPSCGGDIHIQRQIEYMSNFYYNKGLEKATVRDLSGAINYLKLSLTYNKGNINARNLLGLVYFETGEVVAALSEWVISKSLRTTGNIAMYYIQKLQSNKNRLDVINNSIRKYNDALDLCRKGHDDMAAIKLKKILSENSKLIKGYHLLALIYIKNNQWSKARKILKKAATIDKTNTTTLRFLNEVDIQTGKKTPIDNKKQTIVNNKVVEVTRGDKSGLSVNTPIAQNKKHSVIVISLLVGIVLGAMGSWILAMPVMKQNIYKEANKQLINYSESLSSDGASVTDAENKAKESKAESTEATKKMQSLQRQNANMVHLIAAYNLLAQDKRDEAKKELTNVNEALLDKNAKSLFNAINSSINQNNNNALIQQNQNGNQDDGQLDNQGQNYDESQGNDNGGDYQEDNGQ